MTASVTPIRGRLQSKATTEEQRARCTVILNCFAARVALGDVIDGDIDAIFGAHLAITMAVQATLSARLSTPANWVPSDSKPGA